MIVEYDEYETYNNIAGYNRRCIDGQITGCGKCVGYCKYFGHPGFLTDKHRHSRCCLEKHCLYYVEKTKKNKKNSSTPRVADLSQILFAQAKKYTKDMEGLRIISSNKTSNNCYVIRYVTISNYYPIQKIKEQLSITMNIKLQMQQIDCDFERAVELIFQGKE